MPLDLLIARGGYCLVRILFCKQVDKSWTKELD